MLQAIVHCASARGLDARFQLPSKYHVVDGQYDKRFADDLRDKLLKLGIQRHRIDNAIDKSSFARLFGRMNSFKGPISVTFQEPTFGWQTSWPPTA